MVKLEVPIVKLVIKDLVTFDGVKLELIETKELLRLSNDKVVLKDSVITNLNGKVINLQSIMVQYFLMHRQLLLWELRQ